MEWLKINYPTVIVIAVVVILSVLIVIKLIRDRKAGHSSCGGCCGGCPSARFCRMNKNEDDKSGNK